MNDGMTIHTFRFVPSAQKRLERLMDKINAVSAAEVIRDALQHFEWAVDAREEGRRIGSIDDAGDLMLVEFKKN